MTEQEEKEKGEEKIVETEDSIENIKDKLIELTAEFRKKQDELNQQIYNQSKDEFADIDLEKLLTSGEAFHKGEIGKCSFIIKTLTKQESLEVDKLTKNYLDESNEFYKSSVQADILAYVLVEYNGNKSPGKYEAAKTAVGSISDDVVNIVFSVYSRMSRWIRAALDINLKN